MTDFPAGDGPGGYSPILSPSAYEKPRTPTATKFDGRTKDYPLDAAGHWEAIHPVDQGVALAHMVRQGTIKSAPTVGHTLREITHLGKPDLKADVTDRIRRAVPLAALLADGSVVIDRIDVETSGGRLLEATYYRNMKQDPTRTLRRDAVL